MIEVFHIEVLNDECVQHLSFPEILATDTEILYIDQFFKMPKFTEEQMSACLEDIAKKDGRSLRRIAAAHNLHEATVRLRIKKLKAQTIAPKGSKAYRIMQGGGCENITVVGVVNASGRVMDPVIINQGQNFQQSWRGDKALPNTTYGGSEKGWMTSEVMLSWFEQFIKLEKKRPLLLIFDGHLTHFSIDVIKMAIKNNILLMKLPPHVTDILQPLDVAMFGPLKRKWNQVLNDHMGLTGPRNSIRPSDFVNMVCGMWHDAMPSKNASSGFECTGIYPVNRLKYLIDKLDKRLLNKYEEWAKEGKPDDIIEADTPVQIPDLPPLPEEVDFDIQESTSSKNIQITSSPAPLTDIEIPPIPHPPPPGYKWQYHLCLVPIDAEPADTRKTFEECFLDVVKPIEK